MSGFRKAEREKIFKLEESVLNDTPNEVARVYKGLGEIAFTARALGLACRFRGVETVKALVEGGATFKYDETLLKGSYKYFFIDSPPAVPHDFSQFLIKPAEMICDYTVYKYLIDLRDRSGKKPHIISDGERVRVAEYLCGCAERVGFVPEDLLSYMIVTDDTEILSVFKRCGVSLSENKRKTIIKNSGALVLTSENDNKLMKAVSALRSEVGGEKLHITGSMWCSIESRFSNPELFRFILDNFDQSGIKKGSLMEKFILDENVACLEIAAELGWLKAPKKRDEMIAFAAENGKTECTAFLLDFKNRTADFAAERERAERRARRELNADPNSPTELKKVWGWVKRGDGTLVITGYKGDKTEIVVPEKIGGDTVTAVGEYAFSPDAKRILQAQRELRKAITKITMPDTVTEIGEFAFFKCKSLCEVNVPPNVTEIPKGMLDLTGISSFDVGGNVKKIGSGAFYWCHNLKTVIMHEGVEEIDEAAFYNCGALETVELPRSVVKIFSGEWNNSFYGCRSLTIALHKGSYSERFCSENKIPFVYIDN